MTPTDRSIRRFDRLTAVGPSALVSTGAAATYLGISRPTLTELIDRGAIPAEKRGRSRVVRLETLELYRRRAGRSRLPAIGRSSHPSLSAVLEALPASDYAVGGPLAIGLYEQKYRSESLTSTVWTTTRLIERILERDRARFTTFSRHGYPTALSASSPDDQVRVLTWPRGLGRTQVHYTDDGIRVLEPARLLVTCAIEEAARYRVLKEIVGDDSVDFERLAILVSRPGTNLGLVRALFDRVSSDESPLSIPLGLGKADVCTAQLGELGHTATLLIARVLRVLSTTAPAAAVLDPAWVRARRAIVPLERSRWRDLVSEAEPAPLSADRLAAVLLR